MYKTAVYTIFNGDIMHTNDRLETRSLSRPLPPSLREGRGECAPPCRFRKDRTKRDEHLLKMLQTLSNHESAWTMKVF